MRNVCTLQVEKAIEAIQHTETVMYKHDVWNPYYERGTKGVIESIKKSGYVQMFALMKKQACFMSAFLLTAIYGERGRG